MKKKKTGKSTGTGSKLKRRNITKRKKAEDALKESESWLKKLFESSPVAIVISSVDGKIEYTNKDASDMMGYKQNEAIGMATKEFFVDPKERDKSIRMIKKYGQRLNYDFHYKRKDGTTGIAIANSKLIDLGRGPRLVSIQLNDITDRKKAEEKIKHRLELEKTVSTISSRFVGISDINNVINASLADMGRLSGASRAYLFIFNKDGTVMDNTHEWCAEGVSAQINNLKNLPCSMFPWWMEKLRKGEAIHIKDVSKLPKGAKAEKETLEAQDIKSLVVLPLYVGGKLAGFIGFDNVIKTGEWSGEDLALPQISSEIIGNALEREKVEEQLKKYELIVESANDALFIKDLESRYILVNNKVLELFGDIPREKIVGKTDKELMPLEDAMHNIRTDQEVFKTGKQKDFIKKNTIEGKDYWFYTTKIPLKDDKGKIIGLVGIGRDITKTRKLEEKVRILEKKEIPMTNKDKLVLYGLIRYPDLNDIELSKKLNIKRPTLTGIKNKFKRGGFYSTIKVPNLPALGYELMTITYGTLNPTKEDRKEDALFREELRCPEYVHIVSSDVGHYTISVSKNITEYREIRDPIEAKYDRYKLMKDCKTVHFPFNLSNISHLLDYSQSIKDWFKLKVYDKPMETQWNNKKMRKLTENEELVLYALTKYPDMSDKDIAEHVSLNKITVSQIRRRLMKEGFVQTLNIPNLKKLGCELILLMHGRFSSVIKPETRDKLITKELPHSNTRVADIREAISIIPFKDFTEYKEVFDKYIQMQTKSKVFLNDPNTLLIPVNKIKTQKLDFAPPVKKTFGLGVNW